MFDHNRGNIMPETSSFNEVPSYFRFLIKEYLLNLLKNAQDLEELSLNEPIQYYY